MSEGKVDKDNVKKIEEDVFKTSGKIWKPDTMIFCSLEKCKWLKLTPEERENPNRIYNHGQDLQVFKT